MLVARKGQPECCAYEALDVLGRGSFGIVYLAEDVSSPGRQVALKSVSCEGNPGSCTEAAAEAELLQKLCHPNVLRCYEWFEDEGSCSGAGRKIWIVTEYMGGGDLNSVYHSRRQASSPLEAPCIRHVIASVGGALKYIHGMGVLHRDVKCMNVLLSRSFDKMVLADFGLSCTVEESAKLGGSDRHAAALGTPSYMSPEVLCGNPHSAASDAWSLGVLAFKLAALERPFTARDDLTLTMRIMKCQPKELPVDCASDVANAVMGLLDKAPEKRLRAEDAMVWTQGAPMAGLGSMGSKPPPRCLSRL